MTKYVQAAKSPPLVADDTPTRLLLTFKGVTLDHS